MTDLRALAQAVADAQVKLAVCEKAIPRDHHARHGADMALMRAEQALVRACTEPGALVAALNAERAHGYVEAMAEVEAKCDEYVSENGHRRWDIHTMGGCDRLEAVADWARERAAVVKKGE